MLPRRDGEEDDDDDGGGGDDDSGEDDVSMNADNASKRQLGSTLTTMHTPGLRYAVTLESARMGASESPRYAMRLHRAIALIIGETRACIEWKRARARVRKRFFLTRRTVGRATIRDHQPRIITVIRVRGVQRRRNFHNRT